MVITSKSHLNLRKGHVALSNLGVKGHSAVHLEPADQHPASLLFVGREVGKKSPSAPGLSEHEVEPSVY